MSAFQPTIVTTILRRHHSWQGKKIGVLLNRDCGKEARQTTAYAYTFVESSVTLAECVLVSDNSDERARTYGNLV